MPKARKGESTLGGLGSLPRFFKSLSPSMFVFNVFFIRLGQISVAIFCLKIYFLASKKPNAAQNRFQTVTFFFFSMFL